MCSSSADRGVTFTFDDGPGKYTAKLLDVLKELGIRATFFVCGNAALRSPDLVKRMVAEGHEVGSHTFSHQNLTHLMVRIRPYILKMNLKHMSYSPSNHLANLFLNFYTPIIVRCQVI